MKAIFHRRTFHFKTPSGTSRGILTEKHSWFIEIWNEENPEIKGLGECSVIPGLSPDFGDPESYEAKIIEVCELIESTAAENKEHGAWNIEHGLNKFPSILFGVETALRDLHNGGNGIIFENDFSLGLRKIPINGLIWMGDENFMQEQIREKISEGFSTIKMKIGAIDFETELKVLKSIREKYSEKEITLRVDANGAFSPKEAMTVLQELSELQIHSIEQPINAGQWIEMKELCSKTPTPIALDEELIGITDQTEKIRLLETIKPQFIILKPSLHGGISGTQEWIKQAESRNIPWWITSALESNIGLNAICQLCGEYSNPLPQGLGTGSLYTDNIPCDLKVENGFIHKQL